MLRKSLLLALGTLLLVSSQVDAKEVKVKSYIKKDGTKVEGYTKTVKDPDTVTVAGYTKKDGTKVAGYTRKKISK